MGLLSKQSEGLKIIIVGCGKVGTTLVEQLSAEGHDITIIDVDSDLVDRVSTTYDVMGISGNGASYNIQKEAGVATADLIIAVTESDERNLLCCTIARRFVECAAIARVRNPDYSAELNYLRTQLGISLIINPDLEAAREIARLLRLPAALEINSFARGHVELVKFKIPEGNVLHNEQVMALKNFKCDFLMCGVEREEELYIPDGSFMLKSGDIVSILATPSSTQSFFKKIGFDTKQVKNCMIIGGGNTSYYLTKQLAETNINVKIIELDGQRCKELSVLLPKTLIIQGDGGDAALLAEEGIEDIESFVPLTGIDEENILLTLYAKKHSNTKVITKINRTTFNDVIDGMDLGSVIYPRYMTSETIVTYVRAMQNSIGSNIETLYQIFDGRAEAIEFKVERDSPVIGKPIMELKLKSNLLLACINRGGRIIIPRGTDMISAGDRVIIVTTHTGFCDVKDILR